MKNKSFVNPVYLHVFNFQSKRTGNHELKVESNPTRNAGENHLIGPVVSLIGVLYHQVSPTLYVDTGIGFRLGI